MATGRNPGSHTDPVVLEGEIGFDDELCPLWNRARRWWLDKHLDFGPGRHVRVLAGSQQRSGYLYFVLSLQCDSASE